MGLTLILRTVAIEIFWFCLVCVCVWGPGLACGGVCVCVKVRVRVHAQLLSMGMEIFFGVTEVSLPN